MSVRLVALSTKDNPYDFFDETEKWLAYDCLKNYNSCGLLARFMFVAESMSDQEEIDETERAIDQIIKLDLTGNYIKVVREFDSIPT